MNVVVYVLATYSNKCVELVKFVKFCNTDTVIICRNQNALGVAMVTDLCKIKAFLLGPIPIAWNVYQTNIV